MWARVPGHLTPSAATLAIFGDYVSGAVSQPLGRRAMGRSLDNTLRMVQLKPTEWVLCDIRMHALVGGYGQGIAFLWSRGRGPPGDGEPVDRRAPVAGGRRTAPLNRGATTDRPPEAAKLSRHGPPRDAPGNGADRPARSRLSRVAIVAVAGRRRGVPRAGDLARRRTPTHHLAAADPPTGHHDDVHRSARPRPRRRPGRPGPGFNAGQVTAIGDSVMLDYQDPLKTSIPGINVDASVSRQWSEGESILQTLKADGQLGADVIVGLGTNGPITDADFDNMMSILGGASRVVFVNVHVDRPWQDPNNAVLANGATRYPNVVVADWATLAAQNPAVVRGGRHPPGHRRPGGGRARIADRLDAVQRVSGHRPGLRSSEEQATW